MTPVGVDIIKRGIEPYTDNEHRLIAGIGNTARTRLVEALRQLLNGLEPT